MEKKNTPPAATDQQLQEKKDAPVMNQCERFTAKVLSTFGQEIGPIETHEYMRSLIQGYFIGIDRALKLAEEARLRKRKNQDPVPVTWQNVNLTDLALDVMHYAKMGLDMSMDNMLSPIAYKNNKTGLYDVTLLKGYSGVQFIAMKYALDVPVSVTVELVYSTDRFTAIKKSHDHPSDTYAFVITQPFDRGDVVGGFGYIEYSDPRKNKLITMTLAQILKRKPPYAAPEFWGGEKDKWENGQKVGKELIEGWFDEMCYKTLVREVYKSKYILPDPKKIDESFRYMQRRDAEAIEASRRAIIDLDGYAGSDLLDLDPPDDQQRLPSAQIDGSTGEIIDMPEEQSEAVRIDPGQQTMMGKDF